VLPVDRRSGRTHEQKSTSQDAFLSSLPGSHQAPLMGFPKNAPPSGSALVVHSCYEHLQLALSGSRLWLVLARGQVLFRLRGFPPPWRFSPSRVSRVFCTPQPIMGFATLGFDSQDTEMSLQTHLSATPHPSKHLHVCSFSTGSFYKFPGSPEILPSCCSPSENGSTSRLSSADRVREVLWCCHLVPRTASLGFSFKSLWVEPNWKRFDLEVNPLAPVGEPIEAQLSLVFFLFRLPRGVEHSTVALSRSSSEKDSLAAYFARSALERCWRRQNGRAAGPVLLFGPAP
jgi:hypothetical protein